MNQQTIAIDLDDVLATSVKSWVAYSNAQWGTNLTVDDYGEDWAKMWNVDQEEEKRRALQLYESGILSTFERAEQAEKVVKRLSQHYKLVITTSRVEHVRQATLDWVNTHFKDMFEEIHFAGFYDSLQKNATKLTKADLLKSIGADYLIDDQPKHCFAAAEIGINSILFGDYQWSRGIKKLPEHVTRCKDWLAVQEYFDERG